MAAAADEIRRELRDLLARRARGDLRDRDFQRRQTDASVALYRALAEERLRAGERLVAEHHVVHAHFKLTESMLQEPEQVMVSFFATDRRLLRVRGTLRGGRPVTGDDADGTSIDGVDYGKISDVHRRCQRRWGEVAVGLGAVGLSFALGDLLAVTGPLLVGVGLFGALHGMLLPTRWIEIGVDGADQPLVLHGLRKKSARTLLRVLRQALATTEKRQEPPQPEETP